MQYVHVSVPVARLQSSEVYFSVLNSYNCILYSKYSNSSFRDSCTVSCVRVSAQGDSIESRQIAVQKIREKISLFRSQTYIVSRAIRCLILISAAARPPPSAQWKLFRVGANKDIPFCGQNIIAGCVCVLNNTCRGAEQKNSSARCQ